MDRSFLPGDQVRILADYEDIPHNTEASVVKPPFNGIVVVRLSDGREMEVKAGDLFRTDR
jgi:hypothetical protein